jgi:nucleotidyltransferase/DNA polymerase involved in DNA repair
MKKEEVIKGKKYRHYSDASVIITATGVVGVTKNSFEGTESRSTTTNNYNLDNFSPLSEKEYEALRSIPKNEVKEERLESASREIEKILSCYKYVTSITFSKHIKVKFTFIHNKIKFDSLQALQDTLDHLHDLNQDA